MLQDERFTAHRAGCDFLGCGTGVDALVGLDLGSETKALVVQARMKKINGLRDELSGVLPWVG